MSGVCDHDGIVVPETKCMTDVRINQLNMRILLTLFDTQTPKEQQHHVVRVRGYN